MEKHSTLDLYYQELPTQPLRYIGGKQRLGPVILEHFKGIYDPYQRQQYRELFVGSGSLVMEIMRHTAITDFQLSDLNPGVCCYLKATQFFPDRLIRLINSSEFSKLFYAESIEKLKRLKAVPDEPDELVEMAYRMLYVHRYSFSGLGTRSSTPVVNGGNRWNAHNLARAIRIMHERLKENKVHVINCDFEYSILDDSRPAILLLDPPYKSVGDKVYQFGFSVDDHLRLAKTLKQTSHPFLLCYDDHELIHELYGGMAIIKRIEVWHSNRNSKEKKHELIITSKPNPVQVSMHTESKTTSSNAKGILNKTH